MFLGIFAPIVILAITHLPEPPEGEWRRILSDYWTMRNAAIGAIVFVAVFGLADYLNWIVK
jgi:hypothetical protein